MKIGVLSNKQIKADGKNLSLSIVGSKKLFVANYGGDLHICGKKYWAVIFRRKARDSIISSIPFIPSSMLTQPR
jgi:hypothetical protein